MKKLLFVEDSFLKKQNVLTCINRPQRVNHICCFENKSVHYMYSLKASCNDYNLTISVSIFATAFSGYHGKK